MKMLKAYKEAMKMLEDSDLMANLEDQIKVTQQAIAYNTYQSNIYVSGLIKGYKIGYEEGFDSGVYR